MNNMPRQRRTITITQALEERLQKERWDRRARSISAVIEALLWNALESAKQDSTKQETCSEN